MEKIKLARQKLDDGLMELQLQLSNHQIEQLLKYLQLLLKWNKFYSLTAITDLDKMTTHHLLDGLTVINHISSFNNVVDVGSGMGVPGVIIAICCPKLRVTAVDCNQKKTAFLRQVSIELSLTNLTIVNLPVENFIPLEPFDLAISRAFANSILFLSLVRHLFVGKVMLIAMKSKSVASEIEDIKNLERCSCNLVAVTIPGVTDERYLLKIEEKL